MSFNSSNFSSSPSSSHTYTYTHTLDTIERVRTILFKQVVDDSQGEEFGYLFGGAAFDYLLLFLLLATTSLRCMSPMLLRLLLLCWCRVQSQGHWFETLSCARHLHVPLAVRWCGSMVARLTRSQTPGPRSSILDRGTLAAKLEPYRRCHVLWAIVFCWWHNRRLHRAVAANTARTTTMMTTWTLIAMAWWWKMWSAASQSLTSQHRRWHRAERQSPCASLPCRRCPVIPLRSSSCLSSLCCCRWCCCCCCCCCCCWRCVVLQVN